MPNWTTLSFPELRASNKGLIVAAVAQYLNNKTKQTVIELLMDAGIFNRPSIVTRRPDGQRESVETEIEDSLGVKTGSLGLAFSYFATDEVELIDIIDRDENDVEILRRRITHFLDGRQPEIEIV